MNSPSILKGAGSQAHHIAGLWWWLFALAIFVYVVVAGLVVIAVIRGRTDGDSDRGDNATIVIGGLVVPALILFVVGVLTVRTTQEADAASRSGVQIDVTARRWFWDVRYPGVDVASANEIRVPVDRPLTFRIRTADVIHSFWVPDIAGKVDTIPGQTNYLHTTVRKAGHYLGVCAEYCAVQHANMRFEVIAMPPGEFDRWITRRTAVAPGPTNDQQALGEEVFARESCAGCHTIKGLTSGKVGPDLTDLGERGYLGALTIPNTPANLADWIADSQHYKPGNVMPPLRLSNGDLAALVAYLESLR